jgi:hypothetical protein
VTATREELMDAGCWFASDSAGGREMTAFKREARWRQHRWAVDEHSIISFGSHAGRQTQPDEPAEDISNGTKLRDQDAQAGSNFLTPAIYDVAMARVEQRQDHETLDVTRLRRDLLSSMPMAFNLFGEASLPKNEVSRQSLAALFGVTTESASDIVFEWSPSRRSEKYTRDRTAFDVALRLGPPSRPRTVVGIETKYHEHSAKETKPSDAKPGALKRYDEQTEFLVALADSAEVFRPGWQDKVLNTDLRQIWRDHLLALSMRARPREWSHLTRYVLLFPSRNVSFRDAADRYAKNLKDGDTSFQRLTVDDVVDAAFAHGGPTRDMFRRRYLWWVEPASPAPAS